jgi:hypothetical protein
VKSSWKTAQSVKYCARAIAPFVGLLGSVMLCPSGADAQAEIDPDQFDSASLLPALQPKTAERKVTVARYDRTFSLPYSVSCKGKQLASGTYFISLRSDGNVGLATLKQNGSHHRNRECRSDGSAQTAPRSSGRRERQKRANAFGSPGPWVRLCFQSETFGR